MRPTWYAMPMPIPGESSEAQQQWWLAACEAAEEYVDKRKTWAWEYRCTFDSFHWTDRVVWLHMYDCCMRNGHVPPKAVGASPPQMQMCDLDCITGHKELMTASLRTYIKQIRAPWNKVPKAKG